ncbi:MAG: helix-turn-helix domain-containing protein [Sulfitobacter sp.]
MEIMIPNRLSTLGHPQRLAVFRLLMRRYPDRVPASELAQAIGLKPNTLSTYVKALMQAGLITQERLGTSRRYGINMEAARETIGYLLNDCCRGRPDICFPQADPEDGKQMANPAYNVLFICTGNAARSIFAESILRDIAGDRFVAYSAGTRPQSNPNPFTLEMLHQKGHDVSVVKSKNIASFQTPDAPRFDFVFTVCDQAANEECPACQGHPINAHWGLPDPVKAAGSDAEKSLAFQRTYDVLHNRMTAFTALPLASLDRMSLQRAVDEIGQNYQEGPTL